MSRDIEQLIEPFRSKIKALITLAKQEGLPVIVTDTIRTIEEQRENVRKGYSKTMDSKHLTGEAVDIAFQVNGKLSYDAKLYERLYSISKKLSYVIWPYKDLGWQWDMPHFQYDKSKVGKIQDVPYNKDMDEIQKLNTEIGRVTQERDTFRTENKELKSQLKEEISTKIYYYNEWQKNLDKANGLQDKLTKCTQGEMGKLQAILNIIMN